MSNPTWWSEMMHIVYSRTEVNCEPLDGDPVEWMEGDDDGEGD